MFVTFLVDLVLIFHMCILCGKTFSDILKDYLMAFWLSPEVST